MLKAKPQKNEKGFALKGDTRSQTLPGLAFEGAAICLACDPYEPMLVGLCSRLYLLAI